MRAGLARAERAAILHGDLTLQESPIKYRKCPTFDAKRRRFSDFHSVWPSNTDETNEQKNAAESDRKIRLKHKNVKMTQITTVHSLFLG